MSLKSAQDILEHLKSRKWKDEKAYMLKNYGKILSIVEIKEMSLKRGITFREMYEEVTGNSMLFL